VNAFFLASVIAGEVNTETRDLHDTGNSLTNGSMVNEVPVAGDLGSALPFRFSLTEMTGLFKHVIPHGVNTEMRDLLDTGNSLTNGAMVNAVSCGGRSRFCASAPLQLDRDDWVVLEVVSTTLPLRYGLSEMTGLFLSIGFSYDYV